MSGADFASSLLNFFSKFIKFFNSILKKLGINLQEPLVSIAGDID